MTAEREKERQFYISQIFNAQEDERQHIPRELQDETLHPFYVFLNYAHPPLLQDTIQLRFAVSTTLLFIMLDYVHTLKQRMA